MTFTLESCLSSWWCVTVGRDQRHGQSPPQVQRQRLLLQGGSLPLLHRHAQRQGEPTPARTPSQAATVYNQAKSLLSVRGQFLHLALALWLGWELIWHWCYSPWCPCIGLDAFVSSQLLAGSLVASSPSWVAVNPDCPIQLSRGCC